MHRSIVAALVALPCLGTLAVAAPARAQVTLSPKFVVQRSPAPPARDSATVARAHALLEQMLRVAKAEEDYFLLHGRFSARAEDLVGISPPQRGARVQLTVVGDVLVALGTIEGAAAEQLIVSPASLSVRTSTLGGD